MRFKAAERIGIVEETKLEPTFEEGIKIVEAYRLGVDSALDGLEAMMQPNRHVVETGAIVAPTGQNPHELMSSACTKLKQFVSANSQVVTSLPYSEHCAFVRPVFEGDFVLKGRLDTIITSMNKMAEAERFAQTKG
ncbi:hypothetical protein ANCCAN_23112 [Ancylostoma caninum]|uniref:Uncharacterized protein n=1 Tax=Ancylostoma caninum TaxID=29170 RepID=A0A368FJF3_ANCCA|nr:hypothetical protein ANCCAN_23112 [Ancylostoma caninum]